ncbi:hypothetical protein F383_31389 [Gossypium arboreum]|uniref:Uncharacterized protein n=1 Tax=Gossypium arboreum TaxID=29729 RepID=A0A0B0PGV3_GOSAR|nr:hypothetical protein F383_31389 [Gossypium arboreum]
MSLENHVLCDLCESGCWSCTSYWWLGVGHARPTGGWVVRHVLQIPDTLCEQLV